MDGGGGQFVTRRRRRGLKLFVRCPSLLFLSLSLSPSLSLVNHAQKLVGPLVVVVKKKWY